MEVHHHPNVEKKNFKEYFLEFLMIFLAVTMGFFAENIREHFSDQEKEKKYMRTLYNDLKDDTTVLHDDIPFWQTQINRIDTLRSEIKKAERMNLKTACIMSTYMRDYGNFIYHDRSVTQLKSTGNFRLLKSALADSIMKYDSYIVSQLRDIEMHGQKIYTDLNNLQDKIFESGLMDLYRQKGAAYADSLITSNPRAFSIHTENKELVFEYYNALDFWKTAIQWRLYTNNEIQRKAANLIQLIGKEYSFEKE